MHKIVKEGEGGKELERTVSFDTWQRETNIHYEDDKSVTGSRRSKKSLNTKNPKNRPSVPPKPQNAALQLSRYVKGGPSRRDRRQTMNIDPRNFVIGSSPKRDIIGGSHYSRALLVNAQSLTKGPGPENLKYLQDVDHLFFKKCKQFPPEIKNFEPRHKRGIWNSGGRCVYYVGQTEYFRFRSFRSGFTYEIVDYLGRLVMTSEGSQWTLGLKGQVSVKLGDGFLLGTMEQKFFSSRYNIRDGQGRVVYTIQAPCYAPMVPWVVWCSDEEFEICMDDGVSEIGKIARFWGEEFPDFDGDCGIEFETFDDNRVKALLLGTYFLIEFQYYKHGGNGVAYLIFMLICIGITSCLMSNCYGLCPSLNSPTIFEEPVET